MSMKTFNNRAECEKYVQTLSIGQVMDLCVDLLMVNQVPKIFLTQDQFERFFKVQGLRVIPETRGRNKKTEDAAQRALEYALDNEE